MKNNISGRAGQISLGAIAIVVGALVVAVGGTVLYRNATKPAPKPTPAQEIKVTATTDVNALAKQYLAEMQKTNPCNILVNPECPGEQETKANEKAAKAVADAKAEIVSPGEPLGDAVAEPTASKANTTSGTAATANQSVCDPTVNPDCLLQQQARGLDGPLDSQKNLANQSEGWFSVIYDAVNYIPSKIYEIGVSAIDGVNSLLSKLTPRIYPGPLLTPVSKTAPETDNKPLLPPPFPPAKQAPSGTESSTVVPAAPTQSKSTGTEFLPSDLLSSTNLTTPEENQKIWSTLIAMVTPDAAMNVKYTLSELLKDLRARDVKLISSSDALSQNVKFPSKMVCLKSYSDISALYSGNCSASSGLVRFTIKQFPKCSIDFSFNVNTKNSYNKMELGLMQPTLVGINCDTISLKYAPTTSIGPGAAAGHSTANIDINYSFRDTYGEGTLYNGSLNAKLDIGPMRSLTPVESNIIQNEGNF